MQALVGCLACKESRTTFVISNTCALVADSHESIVDGLVLHRYCCLKDWDVRVAARPGQFLRFCTIKPPAVDGENFSRAASIDGRQVYSSSVKAR